MYEAFDSFLDIDTWHTRHPDDEQRFFMVLKKVVRNPVFSPDEMAEHMRKIVDNSQYEDAIDHYAAAAWAVKRYLKATK